MTAKRLLTAEQVTEQSARNRASRVTRQMSDDHNMPGACTAELTGVGVGFRKPQKPVDELWVGEAKDTARRIARATRGGQSEHALQCQIIDWWRLWAPAHGIAPMLLTAFPAGGQRHPAVAAKLKAEGVGLGWPDLQLMLARATFHGFFCELKVGKNTLTPAQTDMHYRLRREGYNVVVCYDFASAERAISMYCNG